MKRLLLVFAVLAAVFTAIPRAEARVNVSVNLFFDTLQPYGRWIDVSGYGYCWQPRVAYTSRTWRPYADGYWAWTDYGWTWVSYEDFGWACYHYGRWVRLAGRGWIWVPGNQWAPAWVSWRTGGNYIGWAPLPPRSAGYVYDDYAPISGRVDIDFNIGPSCYNFVDLRYFGEPVLRERIYAPTQNVTYIQQTVNVTNITYNNSIVYNYGPDYQRLAQYSTRPIQRLNVQRQQDVDLSVAAAQQAPMMQVKGNTLLLASPQVLEKPQEPITPKKVEGKIAQPQVENGWDLVANPKVEQELKQKFQTEDPAKAPTPSLKPVNPAPAQTEPPVAAAESSPAVTADDDAKKKGRGMERKPLERVIPGTNETAPGAQGEQTPQSSDRAVPNRVGKGEIKGSDIPREQEETGAGTIQSQPARKFIPPEDKQKGNRPSETQSVVSPPVEVPPVNAPAPERQRGHGKREIAPEQQPAPATEPAEQAPPQERFSRGNKHADRFAQPPSQTIPAERSAPAQPQQAAPAERHQRPLPPQHVQQPAAPAAAQPAQQPQQQKGGKKPKKGDEQPQQPGEEQ